MGETRTGAGRTVVNNRNATIIDHQKARGAGTPPTVLELTSMSTNTDDGEKVVVRQSDSYGSRHSRLPGVDGASVSVETPEAYGEQSISVSGYSYDDEAGDVELRFGDEVRVGVWVSPSDARALAEQLEIAADEADAEIDDEK